MTKEPHPRKDRLDLHAVLGGLGHSPESFARLIDRNASGLRRIIYGQQAVSRHTAKDIVEGLYTLGYRDDPRQIWQLSKIPPGIVESALREQTASAHQGASSAVSRSDLPVHKALANLMKYVGRKEVDRIYDVVFRIKPDDKNE